MARTKQTARKSTGGKAPRLLLEARKKVPTVRKAGKASGSSVARTPRRNPEPVGPLPLAGFATPGGGYPLAAPTRLPELAFPTAPAARSVPAITNKTKQLGVSYHKHAEFFYEDGNVGIICGRTVFKIDKQLLSRSSHYFSALFLGPGSPAVGEGFFVNPAYTVAKVDGASFGHLMAILYHTNDWMISPPSFKILASILRVSSTLNFARIQAWATHAVKAIWTPDTSSVVRKSLSPVDAVDAILLARAHNIPQLVKRAYYEIVRSPQYDTRVSNLQKSLSNEDVFLILRLRSRLSDSWVSDMQEPPVQMFCRHCAFAPSASPQAFSAFWVERVQKSGILLEYRYDPISGIEAVLKKLNLPQEGLCARCFESVKVWISGRQDMWWNMVDAPPT